MHQHFAIPMQFWWTKIQFWWTFSSGNIWFPIGCLSLLKNFGMSVNGLQMLKIWSIDFNFVVRSYCLTKFNANANFRSICWWEIKNQNFSNIHLNFQYILASHFMVLQKRNQFFFCCWPNWMVKFEFAMVRL